MCLCLKIRKVDGFCLREVLFSSVRSAVRHVHLVQRDMCISCSTTCASGTVRHVHVVHRSLPTLYRLSPIIRYEGLTEVLLYPFYPLFFSMIQIMTGAPKRAVTALTGSVPWKPGICEIRSHINRMMAPHSIEAGRIIRWLGVWNNPRAIWGIVIPIKAIVRWSQVKCLLIVL